MTLIWGVVDDTVKCRLVDCCGEAEESVRNIDSSAVVDCGDVKCEKDGWCLREAENDDDDASAGHHWVEELLMLVESVHWWPVRAVEMSVGAWWRWWWAEGCIGQHLLVDDNDMKCMLVHCFRDAEVLVGAWWRWWWAEGCAGQHSVVDDVDMKYMLVDCFRDAEMMSVGAWRRWWWRMCWTAFSWWWWWWYEVYGGWLLQRS